MSMTLKGKRFLNKVTRKFWIVEDEYGVPNNTAYFDTAIDLLTDETVVVLRYPNNTCKVVAASSAPDWTIFRKLTEARLTGSEYMLEEAYELLEAIVYEYSQ